MKNHEVCDKIYLYGLDEEYNIVRFSRVRNCRLKVDELMAEAIELRYNYQSIRSVYAVDEDPDVEDAFKDVFKRGWVEDRVVFKVLVEKKGIRII